MLNDRLKIVASIAGVYPDVPITEQALTTLTGLLIDDFISMVKHINANKYDVDSAKARIIEMVTTSYNHTPTN